MRLRKLRDEHPGQITLVHRAFVLRPEERKGHFTAYHLQHREAAASRTGLPYQLPEVGSRYPGSSWPALEAAKWVEAHYPEQFEAFDLALFNAFFERTEDISSTNLLSDVARGVGLNADGLAESLAKHEYRNAIWEDHSEAVEMGINGIPTVIIGPYGVNGAVPYEEYERVLKAVLDDK